MRWSKLKALAESRFCDPLRGRLELRSTRYRGTHDQEGRAWITLDKEEVFSACTLTGWAAKARLAREIQTANNCRDFSDPEQYPGYRQAYEQAGAVVAEHGIFTQYQFYAALEEWLNHSLEEALVSPDPLVRAFALLDRRLGQRRLSRLVVGSAEHPLVRRLYHLRLECEQEQRLTDEGLTSSVSPIRRTA
jgi:hypothetical protein